MIKCMHFRHFMQDCVFNSSTFSAYAFRQNVYLSLSFSTLSLLDQPATLKHTKIFLFFIWTQAVPPSAQFQVICQGFKR